MPERLISFSSASPLASRYTWSGIGTRVFIMRGSLPSLGGHATTNAFVFGICRVVFGR